MADAPISVAQLIRDLRRRMVELAGRYRPWLWATAPVLLLCAAVALIRHPSSAFAANARTSVLTVEPTCGHRLTWDLPLGSVVSSTAPPPHPEAAASAPVPKSAASAPAPVAAASAPISVTAQLWAGARARVERVGDGALTIRFDRSPNFAHCVSTQSVAQIDIEPEGGSPAAFVRHEVLANGAQSVPIFYSSSNDAPGSDAVARRDGKSLEFVLPLEGRLLLGTALQQGAGWHHAVAAPLLDKAEISVRTRAALTGQSVVLIEERVDAGSVVDTAPCFEHGGSLFWDGVPPWSSWFDSPDVKATDRAKACASRLGPSAVGFVRAHREGGMEAQLHVQSHRIAITPHQGEPRMLGITLWRALLHSAFAQAVVALVVLLGNGATAWDALKKFSRWLRPSEGGRRRRWRRGAGGRPQSNRSRLP